MTLVWSAVITGILAVVGARHRLLVAGSTGLVSALVGVVLAGLFLGMTALIILIAGRMPPGPTQIPTFFGIVLGGWVIKLVVFIVALCCCAGSRGSSRSCSSSACWSSVIASLVVDIVVMAQRASRTSATSNCPRPRIHSGRTPAVVTNPIP